MNLSTLTSKVGDFLSGGLGLRAEDDLPARIAERRAYTRVRVLFEGSLDCGGVRLPVDGIDLHRAGAKIRSQQPLAPGALVFLYAKSHALMGWATVRWCTWRGQTTYHVGLEFRRPLIRAEAGDWQFSWVDNAPTM